MPLPSPSPQGAALRLLSPAGAVPTPPRARLAAFTFGTTGIYPALCRGWLITRGAAGAVYETFSPEQVPRWEGRRAPAGLGQSGEHWGQTSFPPLGKLGLLGSAGWPSPCCPGAEPRTAAAFRCPQCLLFTKSAPELVRGKVFGGGDSPAPTSFIISLINPGAAALEESFLLLQVLLFPHGQVAEGAAVHAENSLEILVGEVLLGEETRLSSSRGAPQTRVPPPRSPPTPLTSFLLGSTPRGRSSAAVFTSTCRGKVSSLAGVRVVVAVKTSLEVSPWSGEGGTGAGWGQGHPMMGAAVPLQLLVPPAVPPSP